MKALLVSILSLLLFAATGAGNAFAGGEQRLEISPEISHITYEEFVDGSTYMKEDGIMYGIGGVYTYRDRYLLRLEGRYSSGQVDYRNSGRLENIDDYSFEFRGLMGSDYYLSARTTVTSYFGLGYRYLNDDSGGMTTSTGARGYERESNYYYSPLGLEVLTTLDNGWSAGAAFEYDLFWKGRQESHLSDVDPGYNDLNNDQNSGYGLRSSFSFKKESSGVSYSIEPFIRYWNIEKSEEQAVTFSNVIVGFGYEPENTSTEIGVSLTVQY